MLTIDSKLCIPVPISSFRSVFDKMNNQVSDQVSPLAVNFPDFNSLNITIEDLVYTGNLGQISGPRVTKTEAYVPYLLRNYSKGSGGPGVRLKAGDEVKIFDEFCEFIRSCYLSWQLSPARFVLEENDNKVSYGDSFLRELFIGTLVEYEPPAILPELVAPPEKEFVREFSKDFTTLPWKSGYFWWDEWELKELGSGQLKITNKGERGEVLLEQTFDTFPAALTFLLTHYLNFSQATDWRGTHWSHCHFMT